MGGNDHCAVYGCSNSRNQPDKLVVKEHVGILRWHTPKNTQDLKLWGKLINRDKFKVTKNTKVCSNHFTAGYCSDVCRVPTLYMKGYNIQEPLKRKCPTVRSPVIQKKVKVKQINEDDGDVSKPTLTPCVNEHEYELFSTTSSCMRAHAFDKCFLCFEKDNEIRRLLEEIETQKKEIEQLKKQLAEKEKKTHFCIEEVQHSDKYVQVYTGLQNVKLFKWLHNYIKPKAEKLTYFNKDTKQKQRKNRKLDTSSSFFLVLIKLRLGLTDNDLAFRFNIAQSTVSSILNCWIPFLGRELSGFIYWPTREENLSAYPRCFKSFSNVIGIIDCTEGAIEKPSIAKAQAQTYSTYKSKNTWKVLVCVTPSGTVSYLSSTYGGSASDRYITETCGIIDKILPGDSLMADKGFNIGDLLVGKGSKLVIPPFLKDKTKFSKRNANTTSQIAKARIHVERAISRIKDYRILQGAIPITRKDKLDDILTICAALTNLAPPLVPL